MSQLFNALMHSVYNVDYSGDHGFEHGFENAVYALIQGTSLCWGQAKSIIDDTYLPDEHAGSRHWGLYLAALRCAWLSVYGRDKHDLVSVGVKAEDVFIDAVAGPLATYEAKTANEQREYEMRKAFHDDVVKRLAREASQVLDPRVVELAETTLATIKHVDESVLVNIKNDTTMAVYNDKVSVTVPCCIIQYDLYFDPALDDLPFWDMIVFYVNPWTGTLVAKGSVDRAGLEDPDRLISFLIRVRDEVKGS